MRSLSPGCCGVRAFVGCFGVGEVPSVKNKLSSAALHQAHPTEYGDHRADEAGGELVLSELPRPVTALSVFTITTSSMRAN